MILISDCTITGKLMLEATKDCEISIQNNNFLNGKIEIRVPEVHSHGN